MPTHRKSHVAFCFVYFDLTLTHSKDQGQCHTPFDYNYLTSDGKLDKHFNWQLIESRMWPFDWHIFIWPWSILKVKVKVMRISTVNILKIITDRADITIDPNIMLHVGFRLVYLELTLTYSKGQLGRRNDVSLNILTFLLIVQSANSRLKCPSMLIIHFLGFTTYPYYRSLH